MTTTKRKDNNQKIYHEKIKFKLSVWESNPVFGRTEQVPVESTVAHVLLVYEWRVGCRRVYAGLEHLNSGRSVFCDLQIGWAAAGASVCMIEMAVCWISDGGLSAFLYGTYSPIPHATN